MGTIAEKLTYLNTTKGKIKDSINNLGGSIDSNTTFRDYATELDSIYSRLPKVSGTGSNITLTPTLKGRLGSVLKGDTKQSILPSGYTQVDYIQSSGTQYIDTGIIGKKNIKTYADINLIQLEGRNTPMFGCYGNNARCYLGIMSSTGLLGYSYGSTTWSETSISANQRNVIEIDFTQNLQSMKLNGTTILTNTSGYDLNTEQNIYIPGYNNEGTFDTRYPISVKIYRYKIYEGNTLSRDFIPCYRNSDNEVGMYDLVNNVFYTNQGTGSFTYGSVAPTLDSPVDIQCVEGIQNISNNGKNLFDKDGTNFDGHTGINNFNGKQIARNTFVGATCYDLGENNTRCQAYFKGKAGQTYYLSFGSKFGISTNKAFGSDGIITATLPTQNLITMTTDYVGITLKKSDNSEFTDEEVLELKNSIQIEKCTTSTPYQPYQTPQTASVDLGNIKLYDGDKITGTPDNWSVVSNNIVRTLTGTESFGNDGLVSTVRRYTLALTNCKQNDVSNTKYSNYFRYVYNYNLDEPHFYITNSGTLYLFSDITDSTQFKTWLGTHNTDIVYPTETPTTTPITDTTLISQLNNVYNMKSYDDTTNISVEGNLPMIIEASALKGEA